MSGILSESVVLSAWQTHARFRENPPEPEYHCSRSCFCISRNMGPLGACLSIDLYLARGSRSFAVMTCQLILSHEKRPDFCHRSDYRLNPNTYFHADA
jgi:hypothetical protein